MSQQEQILSELYSYVHQEQPPVDAAATKETLQYLEACNKLFENDFLSHEKIVSVDSSVLKNIDEGYKYFTSWLSTVLSEDSMYLVS